MELIIALLTLVFIVGLISIPIMKFIKKDKRVASVQKATLILLFILGALIAFTPFENVMTSLEVLFTIYLFAFLVITIWHMILKEKDVRVWLSAVLLTYALNLIIFLIQYSSEYSIIENMFDYSIAFAVSMFIITTTGLLTRSNHSILLIKILAGSYAASTILLILQPPIDILEIFIAVILMGVTALLPALVIWYSYKKVFKKEETKDGSEAFKRNAGVMDEI